MYRSANEFRDDNRVVFDVGNPVPLEGSKGVVEDKTTGQSTGQSTGNQTKKKNKKKNKKQGHTEAKHTPKQVQNIEKKPKVEEVKLGKMNVDKEPDLKLSDRDKLVISKVEGM